MIRTILAISILFFGLSLEIRTGARDTQNAAPQQRANKAAPNPNQWALLIGVSNYPGEIQDLRFASADARSIKELLISSAGFVEDHIRLLTEDGVGEAKATKQNIFAAVDQYLAPRVQPGHEIIIFLAGHGVVRGLGPQAKSYLLPADTDAQTKESLERTSVDLEELSRKLSSLKASQFTVFFDACRDDPFPGRGLKGNTLTDVTARLLTTVSGRPQQSRSEAPTSVIFYACQIGERAYE
ncbi:MAG: caspase family protein, partial [Blastocatellia bacterium]